MPAQPAAKPPMPRVGAEPELIERAFLGAALTGAQLDDCHLQAEHFSYTYRPIARAVLAAWADQVRPDPVTLADRDSSLNLTQLADLARGTFAAANMGLYAEKIKEGGATRQLQEAIHHAEAQLAEGHSNAAVWNDLLALYDTQAANAAGQRLRAVELGDFLNIELPPRRNLLAPWLPAQGLAMLYASRGVGKTHVALGVAYAVASGGSSLGWKAPEPTGVLYLDGEMPASVMQERLAQVAASAQQEPGAPLRIITPDLQPSGMPDLASDAGQQIIDSHMDGIGLVVVDNLSTLVRSGVENESESWQPVQTWALRHRAAGRSVLFIHHAGKGGNQRGTSRREDVLDTVIALRRPKDYAPTDGARFEVHFEKARGLFGKEAEPFEAMLTTDSRGRATWATKTLAASSFEQVVALAKEGLSAKEITAAVGIDKSRVSRHLAKAKARGLLDD